MSIATNGLEILISLLSYMISPAKFTANKIHIRYILLIGMQSRLFND
jgi:hypothetical protein